MNKNFILNTFKKMESRGWDTLYFAIDIHDTCIKANYKAKPIPTEFFDKAERVLQRISRRSDSCLILYTCSHPAEIEEYKNFFSSKKIHFKYVNENPEAQNTAYGFFEKKFYFNFMFDDKAGFDPENDWAIIEEALDELDGITKAKKSK